MAASHFADYLELTLATKRLDTRQLTTFQPFKKGAASG
jgi:hypothetical protein